MEYKRIRKMVFVLGILLVGEWNPGVQSVSTQEDLTLTRKEKEALDQFRKRVVSIVPHDYMKQDIYLIRWLRAKNLDLNQAETLLRENLKWREANKVDTILDEDFTELDRDYPYQIKFHDREGKPIITANFGDWNLRRLAISGKLPAIALNRHIDRGFENATRRVRQLQDEGMLCLRSCGFGIIIHNQKATDSTRLRCCDPPALLHAPHPLRYNGTYETMRKVDYVNMTPGYYFFNLQLLVINMENYNLPEQGCLQCLPFYLYLVNTYEAHFPVTADIIMSINTPAIFELVLNVLRPLMSPLTRQSLQIYNTNKVQWQSKLLKIVDRNELPIEYGGTNEV